jgi:IMP dehydrogenase
MIAPSLQTEGKSLQTSQGVGMGSRGAASSAHPDTPSGNGAPATDKAPALTAAE